MKYFVLFFLCLSLHAQIDEVLLRNQELDEEEILIFDNKKEVSKFSSFMKGLLSTAALSIQGLTLDGGLNVLSIQNLTAGLVLRSGLLNAQTIQHDVDKVYSYYSKNLPLGKMKDGQEVKERQSLLNHWSEFKVGGRGVVPLNLLAQTNLDALAFYFNNEVGHKRVLDVISPVNESLEKEDRVIDAILGQLKRGFKASKKISISNDPLKLWEKFPAGSEIKREQDYLFVSSVGLRYGTGILNANTGVFGLYHFFGESSFKVLGDPERKLVKFTIRKLNKKGVGGSASTEMNILLFRIFILDARLNIKFVTTTVEASNAKEHIYEYVVDLDYPEAAMALKKAMAGDTTSLHKLGVGRGGAEYYKGVLINQESNSILTDTLWRKRLGLSINENYMKVLEAAASRQKLEKNYLYDETIKLNRNSNLVAQNLYGEKSQIEAYQFQNEKIKNSFWRFKGKYRENSSLKSYVENSDTVKKNIGIVQKDELSFDYNFQLQIKKNSNSLMKKFERTINHVVNLTQIVQESGPFYLEDYCQQENLLIRLKGKISEEAIAYMMRLSKDTHWLLLAKMLGISNSVGLSDNRIRRKAIRPLFKEDKVYKNIKKFEKHFLPTLESLKKSQSKQEMAKHLRNMFRDYNNDPFIYEYILYVNQNEQLDLFSPMAFRNIQTSIFIESPDCKLNWSGNTSESEVSFTK